MKGLKREREEIEKKIDTLTKQRKDELVGSKATKVVIVKGGVRMIIPRSHLRKLAEEETDNDFTVINQEKSLKECDLDDDADAVSCSKCGRKNIQLWREEDCVEVFGNPNVLCIPCLGSFETTSWCEVMQSYTTWIPAIIYKDNLFEFARVSEFRDSKKTKQDFLALPK
jgi:hypothetical protein